MRVSVKRKPLSGIVESGMKGELGIMDQRQKSKSKRVLLIAAAVLGACLLIGVGIWFYCKTAQEARVAQEAKAAQEALAARTALENDLARITVENVTFVSMSYADTPSYASYGTQDAEQMKEAVGWIKNAGFHETFSVPVDRYDWFFYDWFPELRPVGGHQPCYTFTLNDGSKLHFYLDDQDCIKYNGWIYRVDDTGLAAKFRSLYDSVKENAQTYPHQPIKAAN